MPTLATPAERAPALKAARDALVLLVPEQAQITVWSHADEVAAIVQPLGVDDDIVVGALLFPLLSAGLVTIEQATKAVGTTATHIAKECVQLVQFGNAGRAGGKSLSAGQAEALRKMLLAIASDARLVFIRLAEQLYQLRQAKNADEAERQRIARETREIYAPLANRLGIWQLKWELEDLSFRYLDPATYKKIAGWLASKRADRERYLNEVQSELRDSLDKAGIKADIAGRPKHIYSIWRKMQRKGLSFDQIYDVRAVRILVDTITECYAALGIVHGLWPYIPGEFDDYIATPKDNLYRSLHTAVIGPGKLPLEVQIRTREMHDHAELGVAAHWRYKEGGRGDPAYEQKIAWLRHILEPAEQASGSESETDFLDRMREELFEDRVYALSPRGEVVDLPKGATPLDYAYHVHTELGHRCRGAKLNDQMVSLTAIINNGDKVEIITGKQPNPSRDWLVPSLGFLASPRSRAKVRAWFRKQDEDQNRTQGKQLLERELHKLAIHSVTIPELISEFNFDNADQLYLAIGEGELTIPQITGAIQRRTKPQELPTHAKESTDKSAENIRVQGVGELLSTYARCCRPVPPEVIGGYITLGRGVSIHRRNCSNFIRLQDKHPERVIEVDWGREANQQFPVDIIITAYDRRGLVRDVSAVLTDAKISIQSMNTTTQKDGIVDMRLRISVHNLQELSSVISKIQGQANIINVRRQR